MTIGTLFTIFSLLACTATSMGSSDILFLLGLGLHLAIVFRLISATSEVNALLEYILKVVHINGGKGVRR